MVHKMFLSSKCYTDDREGFLNMSEKVDLATGLPTPETGTFLEIATGEHRYLCGCRTTSKR